MGDGVAEWTKASVATRTVAGSNSAAGGIFLWCPLREAVIHHPGMADTYTGVHLKILPKQTHGIFRVHK